MNAAVSEASGVIRIRERATRNRVELFTPTCSRPTNPIEGHFGPPNPRVRQARVQPEKRSLMAMSRPMIARDA